MMKVIYNFKSLTSFTIKNITQLIFNVLYKQLNKKYRNINK